MDKQVEVSSGTRFREKLRWAAAAECSVFAERDGPQDEVLEVVKIVSTHRKHTPLGCKVGSPEGACRPVIVVSGPSPPLTGHLRPPGSKNAALPMLVAAALAGGEVSIERVPRILDVYWLCQILRSLGVGITVTCSGLRVRGGRPVGAHIPGDLSARFRGSVYALAIPAAHLGWASIGPVGGDPLGRNLEGVARAFSGFGMRLNRDLQGFRIDGGPPQPGNFRLGHRGITSTGLAVLLAAATSGRSIIEQVSPEPEIDALLTCVRSLGVGAERDGATLLIEGPFSPQPAACAVPPDRLYCGTLALAAVITGGSVHFPCLVPDMAALLDNLAMAGVHCTSGPSGLTVAGRLVRGCRAESAWFPGFPTDLIPMLLAVLTQAPGMSVLTDRVYGGRFGNAAGLRQLGACVTINGPEAVVRGPNRLQGTRLAGGGIRETAGLLLAALTARGTTVISDATALFRGYEDLPAELARIGAPCYTQTR